MRRALLASLITCGMLAGLPALADDGVRLGETYRGVVQLKTYGSPQVPLPPGDWKLVALGETRSSTTNIRILKGHFIQTVSGKSGQEMAGRISFYVPDSASRGGWVAPPGCARTNVLANFSKPTSMEGYDCVWLTAFGLIRPDKSADELNQFYDYVDRNKIKKPVSVLNASFAISDGRSYLMLDYAFNPDHQGILPVASGLWHPDRYKEDAKRVAHVESLKTWMQAWRGSVAEAYKARLPASFAAAEIFPVSVKTAAPAKAPVSTAKPLGQLADVGKTYRDVFPLNVQGSPKVPLPPGEWKLVAIGEGQFDKEPARLIRGYLVQTKGDALVGRVYFNVPDGPSASGWGLSDNCKRKDPLVDLSIGRSEPGKPFNCASITAYSMARPSSGPPQLTQFHNFLDVNGIKRPVAMINVGYGLSTGKNLMTVEYMFNPELDGVRANTLAAWNKDRFGEDSHRGAYVEKMKAWAQEWRPKVEASFQTAFPRTTASN